MKFEIKHLLWAAAIIAAGLTFRNSIHFHQLALAVTHLFIWWLADLALLKPRFLKVPASVISFAIVLAIDRLWYTPLFDPMFGSSVDRRYRSCLQNLS